MSVIGRLFRKILDSNRAHRHESTEDRSSSGIRGALARKCSPQFDAEEFSRGRKAFSSAKALFKNETPRTMPINPPDSTSTRGRNQARQSVKRCTIERSPSRLRCRKRLGGLIMSDMNSLGPNFPSRKTRQQGVPHGIKTKL